MTGLPPTRAARRRSWLSLAGLVVVVASVALVGVRLRQQLASLRELVNLSMLLQLAGAALSYGVSLLLISYAFWLLLRWQGVGDISLSESHRIYGRTQIAKYLPGNVFQWVARHVEYRQRGAGDVVLGLAALYEALGLAAGAAALALVGLPILGGGRVGQLGLGLGLGLTAAVCGGVALPRLVEWVFQRRGRPLGEKRLTSGHFARLMLLYAGFFVVSGALALSLHARASQGDGLLLAIIPGYALAWLCGFAVPGAAAGLGVREAALVLLFPGDSAALFVGIGMRLVTTLGDAFFLLGVAIWGRSISRRTPATLQDTGERSKHQ